MTLSANAWPAKRQLLSAGSIGAGCSSCVLYVDMTVRRVVLEGAVQLRVSVHQQDERRLGALHAEKQAGVLYTFDDEDMSTAQLALLAGTAAQGELTPAQKALQARLSLRRRLGDWRRAAEQVGLSMGGQIPWTYISGLRASITLSSMYALGKQVIQEIQIWGSCNKCKSEQMCEQLKQGRAVMYTI